MEAVHVSKMSEQLTTMWCKNPKEDHHLITVILTVVHYKPWNNNWSPTVRGFTDSVHSVTITKINIHHKYAMYVTSCETHMC